MEDRRRRLAVSLLELDDVRVWFGGVHAVDGVSMRLDQGRCYGLIGPNGCGKSTLINAITGDARLTAGAIRVCGLDVTGRPAYDSRRGAVSRTFQTTRLIPTLTVRDNVLLATDWARGTQHSKRVRVPIRIERRDALSKAVDELLERFAIDGMRDEFPGVLPYGIQRRVEIARAMITRPKVVLLDEPLAGMNRSERDEIARLLLSLRDPDMALVVVEHDLRALLSLCDRLLVMNEGKLIATGDPQATVRLPVVQEAYMGKRHAAS
jgi:ABC-type branched-subunit amino acid transport system ATPase component